MVRLTVLFSPGDVGAEIQQVLLDGLLRSVSRLAGCRRLVLVASHVVETSRVVVTQSLSL